MDTNRRRTLEIVVEPFWLLRPNVACFPPGICVACSSLQHLSLFQLWALRLATPLCFWGESNHEDEKEEEKENKVEENYLKIKDKAREKIGCEEPEIGRDKRSDPSIDLLFVAS